MANLSHLSSKLNQPPKKVSQFEKHRAEAEAKKAKDQAETAAVLAEFEKSFDDDHNDYSRNSRNEGSSSRGFGTFAPGRRHFTSTGLKSGPGSLPKSGPGSLGPTPGKKRPFDDYGDAKDKRPSFNHREDRTERGYEDGQDTAAARPTLHVSSMPPGVSKSVIEGLFAHTPLNVDSVRLLPFKSSSTLQIERKSSSAIVTLAADTPASDIDTVVSHLQNKYMGFGFNLSISRHLSSAATMGNTLPSNTSASLPFGARPIPQNTSLSRAPPPNQRFAPPSSYTSASPHARGAPAQVVVQTPTDLKLLKLIHKTIEALLTHGPEFEALLMSRPEIQADEKWAWLWDSSSIGGVYYRWRLWDVLTDAASRRKGRISNREVLFEGQPAWAPPDETLPFEYTTQLDQFVSDDDYNSSDEESDDGGRGADLARRYNDHNTSGLTGNDESNDGLGYLNPLAKAKLTHLLSRLPETSARLRRGDVARITAFAIEHAGAGGDEVVMLVTRNVIKPFCKPEGDDWTSASQVGLYVISDILSSSASSGVRHAWRYRSLFEQALRQQKVFEKLGRAEKDLKWGKLKGEKWKRSIQVLLSLWEGWSVFPQAAHESFANAFLNPPLTKEEEALAQAEAARKTDTDGSKSKTINKWRSVEEDGTQLDHIDGAPMLQDQDEDDFMDYSIENIDGTALADSSDEESMQVDSDLAPRPAEAQNDLVPVHNQAVPLVKDRSSSIDIPTSGARRSRPKAADMFGSEDEK